jgi:hypothetical protein
MSELCSGKQSARRANQRGPDGSEYVFVSRFVIDRDHDEVGVPGGPAVTGKSAMFVLLSVPVRRTVNWTALGPSGTGVVIQPVVSEAEGAGVNLWHPSEGFGVVHEATIGPPGLPGISTPLRHSSGHSGRNCVVSVRVGVVPLVVCGCKAQNRAQFRTPGDPQLGVGSLQVRLHGARREHESLSNGGAREARASQVHDLPLAGRQRRASA